jgi:hypothetical protein
MNKLLIIAALSASLAGCVVFGHWRGYDNGRYDNGRYDHGRYDHRQEQRDQRHDRYSDNRYGDYH